MANTKKIKAKRQPKRPANNGEKGLHFYHWKTRYEFDPSGHIDRFKAGPLDYVKYFVRSGQDDDTISYARQMDTIDNHPLADMLCRDFNRLIKISANQSLCYRGYVLDETFRPVSIKTIAGWLRRDVKTMTKIINTLIDVRLLEMVVLPDFKPVSGKRKKTPVISGSDRQTTGSRPAATGKRPQNRYKNGKGEVVSNNGKRLTANNNKNKKTAKSRKTKAEAENKSRSRKQKPKPKSKQNIPNNGYDKNKSANEALLPKPLMPPQSRPLSGAMQTGEHPSASPGKSDTPLIKSEEDFVRFAKTLAPVEVKFGLEVYRLLRCQSDHGEPEKFPGCRQYITFTNAMRRAIVAGLSTNELDKLTLSMFKEAEKKGRQRYTKHWIVSCEAAWMDKFNKRLLSYVGSKTDSG